MQGLRQASQPASHRKRWRPYRCGDTRRRNGHAGSTFDAGFEVETSRRYPISCRALKQGDQLVFVGVKVGVSEGEVGGRVDDYGSRRACASELLRVREAVRQVAGGDSRVLVD